MGWRWGWRRRGIGMCIVVEEDVEGQADNFRRSNRTGHISRKGKGQ